MELKLERQCAYCLKTQDFKVVEIKRLGRWVRLHVRCTVCGFHDYLLEQVRTLEQLLRGD